MDGCSCGSIGGDEPSLMVKIASHPNSVRTLKSLIGASQRTALEKAKVEQAEVAEAERKRKAEQTALQAASDLIVEAMTKGQATDCPKCSATFRKDDQCMHMICKICRTDFCYVCGKDTTKCVRGRDCDRLSCYLESNPGWDRFARAGESNGAGALYEFQRLKIAFLVNQAKDKIAEDVWEALKAEKPDMLTDILAGRSVTWEEVDAAKNMPELGVRAPAGPPGDADATGFATGMRVRVVDDAVELERMADGFGGWNPAMATACGQIGVVEDTNGRWVSVGFGGRAWALNPAALTRVPDDEADVDALDDFGMEDIVAMIGDDGLRELASAHTIPAAA